MSRPRVPFLERFINSISVDPVTGCWNSLLAKDKNGYSRMNKPEKRKAGVYLHRASYELFIEPIKPGKVIDHLCRNPACCNPEHLEVVTVQINTLRGVGPTSILAKRTHCNHGHEFTVINTGKRGYYRYCKACRRLYDQKRWRNKNVLQASKPAD